MFKVQYLMVLGLLAGLALGFGIVHADFATYQVKTGTNFFPGPDHDDYDDMRHTSSGGVPTHDYFQRFILKGKSAYPGATYAKLSHGHYKYRSTTDGKTCFYKTLITTEAGNNTLWGSMWSGVTLNGSLNHARRITWEYSSFSANDKNLNVAQKMAVPFWSNQDCSYGMSFSNLMEHYTDWQVH